MRRAKRWVAVFMLMSLVLTGCSTGLEDFYKDVKPADIAKKEEPAKEEKLEQKTKKKVAETAVVEQEEEEDEEEIPEGMVKSYLTGEFVPEEQGRRRPVAIMLNNIVDACPQYGISRAGVVYEAPVEGQITRLMGIFEQYDDLDKIGSVRSCREYYIFFATEFNALYAHYGQAAYAVPYLEQDFVHNLSGLSQFGSDIYYRTSDRKAPHNAYTSYEGIQKGIADYGYSQEYDASYDGHYQFAKVGEMIELQDENGATPANLVKLDCFNHNKPWFEYDASTGKYKRFQFGDIQIDEMTGEQLTFDNILIQYTSYKPYDKNGYLNLDVIYGGEGKYITHGKAIDVRWEKDATWGRTHYITKQNQEITMNTGKTFVAIVLDDTVDQLTIQ